MGFFDFTLRCALVVASVLADGGGLRGDEHRDNNVEIGLGKGGLIASFSEPRADGAGFAPARNFSGPEHGSLHDSAGDFGHNRLANNNIGANFGDHGVAGQFGNRGDAKDIGHDFDGVDIEDDFKGTFVGGITRLQNVFGGQNFGGVGGRGNGGIKSNFESGIVQGPNIDDNVQGGRGTFTGSHGAGHAGGPFIVQGKGIKFGGANSKQGNSFAGRQGTGFVSSHRGFGASLHGSQDSKLFAGSGDGIGRGHGTLGGKFDGFSGDHGRGQVNAHKTNLGDGILEMLEGEKLNKFNAGVVDGHLQPLAGKSHQSFSSGIHAKGFSNFGGGIGGDFSRHDNLQGNIGSGLSSSGDIGHGKAGSFGNVGSLGKNGGFQGGNEHGHSSSLGFNSGSDFIAKDAIRGQGAVIEGGVGGGFSQQSIFLGGSSLGSSGSGFSGDILRRDIHSSVSGGNLGGRTKEGAFGDNGGKLRESAHHAVFRGDVINSSVSTGSLRHFVGGDALDGIHRGKTSSFNHEGHDGGSIGDFGSSIGDVGKDGGSIGGFGSSPIHEGKDDGGSFGGFSSSIGHGKGIEHGGSFGSFSSSTVHGGKGGGSIGDFGGSTVQGREIVGGSFGGVGTTPVHGVKGGGSLGGFVRGNVHGGKDDLLFGQHPIVGGVGGGGNFFGYKEDDFLASKDDLDFIGGLAGGFDGGHGARAVNFDGHELHVGGSDLGVFGGALSGSDGGHGGFAFNSKFIVRSAGRQGGAVGSSIKSGHGGGVQSFDGADNLSNFDGDVGSKGFGTIGSKGFGDIGGKGFGNIGEEDFEGLRGFEGGKFEGPGVTVHDRENHAFREGKSGNIMGGVKGGFGDDKSPVGKFGEVVGVHGGRGHDGGAGSSVGGVQGKGIQATHQPSNPFGINGSQ